MKSFIKQTVFGSSKGVRKILFGPAEGIRMIIDPLNKSQRILGLDEREILHPFVQFAKRSDSLIDIGSSDGYYCLIFRKYNNTGVIYSCDGNFNFLPEQLENFKLNNFDSKQNFVYTERLFGDINDEKYITVDSFVDFAALKNPLLKIDVDGAELSVLRGADMLLTSLNCLVIIETHSLELEQGCISALRHYGYTTTIVNNAWWRAVVPEERNLPHNRWLLAQKIGR